MGLSGKGWLSGIRLLQPVRAQIVPAGVARRPHVKITNW